MISASETSPSVPDPSRQYNGRVFDPGTGFHDYGARLYWPQIGRFISPDTAGPDLANPASLNRYAYTFNNPYKYTDPDGHNPLLVTAGIGAGLGAVYGAYTSYQAEGKINWTTVINDASIGGMIGLTAGVAGPALAGAIEGSGAAAAGAGAAAGAAQAGKSIPGNVDANKMHHIFDQARHGLDSLVEQFGSREDAFAALQKATQSAVNSQKLTTFTKGITVDVGGTSVAVRGTVVDGVARIGTAFIQSGGE